MGPTFSQEKNFLTKYKVPLKNGNNIETWALDWPYNLHRYGNEEYGDSRSILVNSFANATIFEDSYEKYENTKLFLDSAENKNPEHFA